MKQDTATIVGSGLAGTLLALYLERAGYSVDLYERRADPRLRQERGRSINLALSTRGLHALTEVGLAEKVLASAVPMRGRMLHSREGRQLFQYYGKDDSEVLYSVSRSGLNCVLVESLAECHNVRMHFNHRCTGLDLATNTLEFQVNGSPTPVQVQSPFILGADGVYSAVRQALQRRERFNFSQEYLGHGYKELTIPAGPNHVFRLEPNALHIWPRNDFMMIALPNADGSFTCTLFWPYEGPNSFASLESPAQIVAFFMAEFPDAVPLLTDLVQEFQNNPVGPLVTLRCSPWHLEDRVVLIGDACHAVVPFLGQGMNAAFEDCSVLVECLTKQMRTYLTHSAQESTRKSVRARALDAYELARRPHADTLANLCVENFKEMRARVNSPLFLLKKKATNLLHGLLGHWYQPLYTMVEFTRIPYAEAVRRARWQGRLLTGFGLGLITLIALLAYWLF